MTTAAFDFRAMTWVIVRISLLLLLFILQFEIVEISLREYFHAGNIKQSIWASVPGRRYIFSFLFVVLAAFMVISRLRLARHADEFIQSVKSHPWLRHFLFQLAGFAGFAFLTWLLSTRYPEIGNWIVPLLVLWLAFLLMTGSFMLLALAPKKYWLQLFREEKNALLIAVLVAVLTIFATSMLSQFWSSMVGLTLNFSEFLLQLIYSNVFVIPETSTLGIGQFDVQVTKACAGYEGIALITVFLSLYLWLFKDDLRFPRVFILFPIGIAAMWVFNGLRIAALVAIGTSYSPEIAIAGFHSNAGWIAFILVSLGLIGIMHSVPFFNNFQSQGHHVAGESAKMSSALLIPMMVLLAATLLTSAASVDFDWLYPLKVLATAIALAVFWRSYKFCRPYFSIEAIVIGIAIFLLWLVLVPFEAEKTSLFAEQLSGVAPWLLITWLAFRCIGSAITVPLAEELAFRGYILSRLSGSELSQNSAPAFSWLAFLGSSILFGVFHGAWFAGTLAGMGYALARYRRGRVSDAVLAHMTTNALLSVYVLMTQQWSYW